MKILGWYSVIILFLTVISLAGDAASGVDTGNSVMGILLILPVLHFVFQKTK